MLFISKALLILAKHRYTYDNQGRVIEVLDRNFAMESVTIIHYNEHGDKSEERIIRKSNLAFPSGVQYSMGDDGSLVPAGPMPDTPSLPKLLLEPVITEYRYEYDQNGNWTQETALHRSGSANSSTVTMRRRTLAYY